MEDENLFVAQIMLSLSKSSIFISWNIINDFKTFAYELFQAQYSFEYNIIKCPLKQGSLVNIPLVDIPLDCKQVLHKTKNSLIKIFDHDELFHISTFSQNKLKCYFGGEIEEKFKYAPYCQFLVLERFHFVLENINLNDDYIHVNVKREHMLGCFNAPFSYYLTPSDIDVIALQSPKLYCDENYIINAEKYKHFLGSETSFSHFFDNICFYAKKREIKAFWIKDRPNIKFDVTKSIEFYSVFVNYINIQKFPSGDIVSALKDCI